MTALEYFTVIPLRHKAQISGTRSNLTYKCWSKGYRTWQERPRVCFTFSMSSIETSNVPRTEGIWNFILMHIYKYGALKTELIMCCAFYFCHISSYNHRIHLKYLCIMSPWTFKLFLRVQNLPQTKLTVPGHLRKQQAVPSIWLHKISWSWNQRLHIINVVSQDKYCKF